MTPSTLSAIALGLSASSLFGILYERRRRIKAEQEVARLRATLQPDVLQFAQHRTCALSSLCVDFYLLERATSRNEAMDIAQRLADKIPGSVDLHGRAFILGGQEALDRMLDQEHIARLAGSEDPSGLIGKLFECYGALVQGMKSTAEVDKALALVRRSITTPHFARGAVGEVLSTLAIIAVAEDDAESQSGAAHAKLPELIALYEQILTTNEGNLSDRDRETAEAVLENLDLLGGLLSPEHLYRVMSLAFNRAFDIPTLQTTYRSALRVSKMTPDYLVRLRAHITQRVSGRRRKSVRAQKDWVDRLLDIIDQRLK